MEIIIIANKLGRFPTVGMIVQIAEKFAESVPKS